MRLNRQFAWHEWQWILLVLSIVPLVGCTSKVVGVWKDSSFSPANLSSARIYIGGIGSSVTSGDEEDALQLELDSLAWSVIDHELPDYDLVPLDESRQSIGTGLTRTLVSEFEKRGLIDSLDAIKLAGTLDGEKAFVIVGRMAENRVDTKTVTTDSKTYDEFTRRMTFQFSVFDATRGRVVWNGAVSDKRTEYVDHIEGNSVSSIGDLIGSLIVDALSPSPTGAPNSSESAKSIFRKFAKEISGKD